MPRPGIDQRGRVHQRRAKPAQCIVATIATRVTPAHPACLKRTMVPLQGLDEVSHFGGYRMERPLHGWRLGPAPVIVLAPKACSASSFTTKKWSGCAHLARFLS